MKKLVAGLLCLAMSFGLFAGAAFAKDDKMITADDLVIIKTEIEADVAANYESYGSLSISKIQNEETGEYDRYQQYALINRDGEFAFKYKENEDTYKDSRYIVSDGYVLVSNSADAWSKYYSWGSEIYDLNGKVPFEPEYTLKDYHFEEEADWISEGAEIEYTHRYMFLTPFSDGVALAKETISAHVTVPGEWGGGKDEVRIHIIDKNGKILKTFSCDEGIGRDLELATHKGVMGGFWNYQWPSEGLIELTTSEKGENEYNATTIFFDYDGNIVISLPGYVGAGSFSEGLAAVDNNADSTTGCGYIDKTGEIVIPCIYEDGYPFNDGLARVKKDGKWGYINTAGETVIPFEYDSAYGSGNGIASVGKDGKYGLVNYNNDIVLPLEYDDISGVVDGVVYAVKDRTVYIIRLKESEQTCETHSWDKGVATKEATCKETGIMTYTCTVCGETKTEVIPKTDHAFGDWEVSKQATAVKDGEEVRICQNCGEKETRTVKAAGQLFTDVQDPKAWFYDKVYEIAATTNNKNTSLMSGYNNGSGNFGPADPLTRQDFAVILYRLADEPTVKDSKNPFPDADPKGYYYKAAVWAQKEGIITGYNDGRFGVGHNITREQVATILYRYAKDYLKLDTKEDIKNGDLTKFKDGKTVSDFAKDALAWANGAGIITGKENPDGSTRIDPQGNAARAEIGTMIIRFIAHTNQK